MEKKEFKASQISKWKKYKWLIKDMAGLYIHKLIAMLSRDPEVKELYQEMREALIQEGDQPKAVQISNEMRAKITVNTQEMVN